MIFLTKDKIISEIEEAFEGVTLDGGISLAQTKVIDDYGDLTSREFVELPSREITDDWKAIPSSVLDAADCLPYLDAKGFRYYIPALMLRLLETYDSSPARDISTLSSLYPKQESSEFRYAELTQVQARAIAHFIEVLPELVQLKGADVPVVERAYRNYWSKKDK